MSLCLRIDKSKLSQLRVLIDEEAHRQSQGLAAGCIYHDLNKNFC